jgi:hypothetical protein
MVFFSERSTLNKTLLTLIAAQLAFVHNFYWNWTSAKSCDYPHVKEWSVYVRESETSADVRLRFRSSLILISVIVRTEADELRLSRVHVWSAAMRARFFFLSATNGFLPSRCMSEIRSSEKNMACGRAECKVSLYRQTSHTSSRNSA